MPTNPIDLTAIANVKAYLAPFASTTDDQLIQDCITSASLQFLIWTGRGNADGSVPTTSPFNSVVTYTETYDGSGSDRLFLDNSPIQSIVSLTISGSTIAQSPDNITPGWAIDRSKKSIVLIGSVPRGVTLPGTGAYVMSGTSYRMPSNNFIFAPGRQNVAIQYTAGYSVTPFDVEMCVRKLVALNYKRRQWIDQKSQAMSGGAGTLSYRDWEMSPDIEHTVRDYQRRSYAY